jgi:hypothetical protein
MQVAALSLRISKAESKALRDRARKEGVSQSNIVRRALRSYGVTPEPESKSGYDVVKHILGKCRAGTHKDLSSNPRHMADYGK